MNGLSTSLAAGAGTQHDADLAEPLMTVAEVAAQLQVSKQTIYNWVYAHELPHRRFGPAGRVIRFTRADIVEYVASRAR